MRVRDRIARVLGLALIALSAFPSRGSGQEPCATEWPLRESLRIGSLDGPDALGEVRSLAIGPTRELFVAQYMVGSLSVFSPEGRYLGAFGRTGQGPGEFENAPAWATWRGDTLWVSDSFRSQSFDAEGRPQAFIRFRTSFPEESARYTPGLPLADGSFWGQHWLSPQLGPVPYGPETGSMSVRRFSASGDVLGVIASIELGDRFVQIDDGPSFREHPMWELLPGSHFAQLEQNVTRDRSALVLLGDVAETSFEVLRIGLAGDTLSRWSVAYAPVPVSRAFATWLGEQFAWLMAGDFSAGLPGWATRSTEARNRIRSKVSASFWTPRFHPPVREIIAGSDDTVWLLRELPEPGGADRWEVYDSEGRLLGRVRVPEGRSGHLPWAPRLRLLDASRERIWATSLDELDVPYIHRFEISDACR